MLKNIPLGGGQVVCGRGWTTMVPGSAPHSSPRTFVGEHAGERRGRKEAERERHGSSWAGRCVGGRCCGGPGQRAAHGRAHQREKERQRCVEISPEGRENKHILVKFATCLGLPE